MPWRGAWLIAAVWVTATGIKRIKAAKIATGEAGRLRALLGAAPRASLARRYERTDQRGPAGWFSWLGLNELPSFLSELLGADNVFSREDAEALAREINAAQRAGRAFSRSLRIRDSQRVLMVRGARAEDRVAEGGAVLWFFDATEHLQENRASGRGSCEAGQGDRGALGTD